MFQNHALLVPIVIFSLRLSKSERNWSLKFQKLYDIGP
jgi:hypothetical protein